jgi:hypothetical protein
VSSASHVVADLTNLDARVALELGVAHTLGKPCLLVVEGESLADDVDIGRLFPALSGDTVHAYSASDRYAALERTLADFLGATSA